MKKYETAIDVINEGENRNDAAERAGSFIDGHMMENGTTVVCGATCLIRKKVKIAGAFGRQCARDKYRTSFYVTNTAETELEAGEKANDLFDIRAMPERSSVIWLFTRSVGPVRTQEYTLGRGPADKEQVCV